MYNEQSSSHTVDAALEAQEPRHDRLDPNPDEILATAQLTLPESSHGEASSPTIAQPPLTSEAKEQVTKEESEEEEEDLYAALQEDEETRDYTPDFIKTMLENPPVPVGMTKDLFRTIFNAVGESMLPHRPKSDMEFLNVFNAAKAIVNLLWLDGFTERLVKNNQRAAVEALHLKLIALVPSSKKEKEDCHREAKEIAKDYFSHPGHRTEFSLRLERGGFGADAVVSEALQRALPSLGKIEAMRKAAIKERDQALKELERAYSSRDPHQRMPLSTAAQRNFYNQVREDKELERQERLSEEAKKVTRDGDA